MSEDLQYLYRYEAEFFENDTEPHIRLWRFPIVERTPSSVVFIAWGRKRRAYNGSRASFAKPSIPEAKESFRIRKSHARSYAERRRQDAEACLAKLKDDEAWSKIDSQPATSGRSA